MVEIKLGKINPLTLELYSSCKELPIDRLQEVEKLSCRDLGIGSTMEDFVKHFTPLHAYLSNAKYSEAIQETKNLHNNYFYMVEKISIWSYSFCPFIKSIGGKPYEIGELEDYKETITKLSKKGLTSGMCKETIDDLKKKLTQSFNPIFLIDSIKTEELTHYLN